MIPIPIGPKSKTTLPLETLMIWPFTILPGLGKKNSSLERRSFIDLISEFKIFILFIEHPLITIVFDLRLSGRLSTFKIYFCSKTISHLPKFCNPRSGAATVRSRAVAAWPWSHDRNLPHFPHHLLNLCSGLDKQALKPSRSLPEFLQLCKLHS